MFEGFYGMKVTPFTREIPTDAVYMSHDVDEILNRMKYVAQRQLFATLTGDCGTGKSLVLRKLRDSLDPRRYKFLYISDSSLAPSAFYRTINRQLGLESRYRRSEAREQLHQELKVLKAMDGITPVCVCDETHLYSKEMLEETRFLLNTDMDSRSPMALILCGQTELMKRLKLKTYTAIFQRIDFQCVMNHFDRSETGEYIRSQMQYAGVDHEIFTDKAIDMIFEFTTGTARMINKVCTSLLMYGDQERLKIIDDHAVQIILEHEFS